MGVPVLILGESGTGKTTSLRNLTPETTGVVNVCGKPLPFRNKLETVTTDKPETIVKAIRDWDKPIIVVDDWQYVITNEFMRRWSEKGFDKFSEMAHHYWWVIQSVIKEAPANKIVYFLSHLERDASGNEKAKTIGKLLDEKVCVEGMFTLVLKTCVSDGVYGFRTQNSGGDTVKSPMGMFDKEVIDNDLSYVDKVIREYYGLGMEVTKK